MDEDAPVFLVEVFDSPGFWVEFDGSGYAGCVFLVWEPDAGDLRGEGAGDEGTKEGGVVVLGVDGACTVQAVIREEADLREGGEVLRSI